MEINSKLARANHLATKMDRKKEHMTMASPNCLLSSTLEQVYCDYEFDSSVEIIYEEKVTEWLREKNVTLYHRPNGDKEKPRRKGDKMHSKFRIRF